MDAAAVSYPAFAADLAGCVRRIAIDGPAGAGKSTVRASVARELGLHLPRHRRHVPRGGAGSRCRNRGRPRPAGREMASRWTTAPPADEPGVLLDGRRRERRASAPRRSPTRPPAWRPTGRQRRHGGQAAAPAEQRRLGRRGPRHRHGRRPRRRAEGVPDRRRARARPPAGVEQHQDPEAVLAELAARDERDRSRAHAPLRAAAGRGRARHQLAHRGGGRRPHRRAGSRRRRARVARRSLASVRHEGRDRRLSERRQVLARQPAHGFPRGGRPRAPGGHPRPQGASHASGTAARFTLIDTGGIDCSTRPRRAPADPGAGARGARRTPTSRCWSSTPGRAAAGDRSWPTCCARQPAAGHRRRQQVRRPRGPPAGGRVPPPRPR